MIPAAARTRSTTLVAALLVLGSPFHAHAGVTDMRALSVFRTTLMSIAAMMAAARGRRVNTLLVQVPGRGIG